MSESRNRAALLKIVGLLLVFFLTTPVLAATVRLPSGERVEISPEQVEKLKKQPGIYLIKHPPAGGLRHVILIPLPKELGDGFLLGTPKDVSAALDAVGVTGTARQRVPGTFSGEIGIAGRITDGEDDSAKAQEYRDLETPVYGDLRVKYEKQDRYSVEVTGENIGRNDQHYSAAAGRYGKFKIQASYDELTHK